MKRDPIEVQAARDLLAKVEAEECAVLHQMEVYNARESFLSFVRFTEPDPDKPEDPRLSLYTVRPVHKLLAATLERIEKGELQRVIFTMPPRTGKTKLTSHKLPAWFIGRNPRRSVIVATYNGVFAGDYGVAIQECIKSDRYAEVFPEVQLLGNARSASRMTTNKGGSIFCIGRGNSATGRGCDLMLLDDLFKDKKEANSIVIRDNVWQWFTSVAMTRQMSSAGRVVIVMTRWHEDDLVGRLTNPDNAFYKPEEANRWVVINIPALAEEGDLLNRQLGEVLWPERFPKDFLEEHRLRDPQMFSALYQGHPTPEEGTFFKAEQIHVYKPREVPENLRYYVCSDHGVTTNATSNKTCMIVGGVDAQLDLWLVDCFWRKVDAEAAVEAMLLFMRQYQPQSWTAELGHISKAIGPFLRRRMREENVHCLINEIPTGRKDKERRCQPIQARMSMGRVHFPAHAWWLEDAKRELLQFPNSGEDDFPDALGLFGVQIDKMVAPGRGTASRDSRHVPRLGTLEWVKASAEARRRFESNQNTGW